MMGKINSCVFKTKKIWEQKWAERNKSCGQKRAESATAQSQDEKDILYILVRKMDRTTYWGYSLSWYNLAGERAKWWDQIKRKGGKKIERRDRIKEKKDIFTSFKVHSADNQTLLWGHHPGTGSESGSPFPFINPIIHPSPCSTQSPQSTVEGRLAK